MPEVRLTGTEHTDQVHDRLEAATEQQPATSEGGCVLGADTGRKQHPDAGCEALSIPASTRPANHVDVFHRMNARTAGAPCS
eukprot:CAMPEP_0185206532 /NCGR_PEP_ID=MMETSP1140-20130426/58631_1 /TAXON_ID=298111 /ORGANISM="Pavlova sp., Strain CCMP459" /LENGTH=81 /DNA_ID=CAMNT_0027774175 /DNA_START=178 /DNA_END=424 /DNA_ORIENTATION=-